MPKGRTREQQSDARRPHAPAGGLALSDAVMVSHP
jgi:hypothetical protein